MESVPQDSVDQNEELVRRMARGEQEALASFYDLHASTLMAVAVRVLSDTATAEDVVQEVFVQIWNKAPTYDRDLGRPLGWAMVMTPNRAIDRPRACDRASKLVERAGIEMESVQETAPTPADQDRSEHLKGALSDLPAEQRTAIEMAFFQGLSRTEIAEQLKLPLGTIKARIRRGMFRLRDKLERIL